MNNLRKLRKARRLSQAQLSQQTNILGPIIKMWENKDATIDEHYIKVLTEFFQVSEEELLNK